MVPTFGMFDFHPTRVAALSADDAEREGYLAEVTRHSTQFGHGVLNEAAAHTEEGLRLALMHRF